MVDARRKVAAYKDYFQKKYTEDVLKILSESRSMDEADQKLERTIMRYDEAWERVKDYYADDIKEEEDEQDD